jgi:hypothetical protein
VIFVARDGRQGRVLYSGSGALELCSSAEALFVADGQAGRIVMISRRVAGARVLLEAQPQASLVRISVAGEWLYLSGFSRNRVERLSVEGGERSTVCPAGRTVHSLIAGDGGLYLGHWIEVAGQRTRGAIEQVDLSSRACRRLVSDLSYPIRLCLLSSGQVAFADHGTRNPNLFSDGAIGWVEPASGTVERRFGDLIAPSAVCADGKWLYFSLFGSLDRRFTDGKLGRVRLGAGGGVELVSSVEAPVDLALDGQWLYVAESLRGSVRIVDHAGEDPPSPWVMRYSGSGVVHRILVDDEHLFVSVYDDEQSQLLRFEKPD